MNPSGVIELHEIKQPTRLFDHEHIVRPAVKSNPAKLFGKTGKLADAQKRSLNWYQAEDAELCAYELDEIQICAKLGGVSALFDSYASLELCLLQLVSRACSPEFALTLPPGANIFFVRDQVYSQQIWHVFLDKRDNSWHIGAGEIGQAIWYRGCRFFTPSRSG